MAPYATHTRLNSEIEKKEIILFSPRGWLLHIQHYTRAKSIGLCYHHYLLDSHPRLPLATPFWLTRYELEQRPPSSTADWPSRKTSLEDCIDRETTQTAISAAAAGTTARRPRHRSYVTARLHICCSKAISVFARERKSERMERDAQVSKL